MERHASLDDFASIVYQELDADTSREIQRVVIQGLTGGLTTRAVHDDRQFHLRTSPLLTVGDRYNVITSYRNTLEGLKLSIDGMRFKKLS